MALELTEAILDEIEAKADATDRHVTVAQWPIIRDIVLEAAARCIAMKGCDAEVCAHEVCRTYRVSVARILAMKGGE